MEKVFFPISGELFWRPRRCKIHETIFNSKRKETIPKFNVRRNHFGINSIAAKSNRKFCENEKVCPILGVWFIAVSSSMGTLLIPF